MSGRLLERALAIPRFTRALRTERDDEMLEAAIAWVRGEVSTGALTAAMLDQPGYRSEGNVLLKMLSQLRLAAMERRLTIEWVVAQPKEEA